MLDPEKPEITTLPQKKSKKPVPLLQVFCAVAAYYRPLRVLWSSWGNVGTPLPIEVIGAYYPLGEEQSPPCGALYRDNPP